MRSILILTTGILLLFLAPFCCKAQGPNGIQLHEVKSKTFVYQIRVEGLKNENDAAKLDEVMLSKEVVLSSSTDYDKGITTAEVLKDFNTDLFHDLVEFKGYKIAKSFYE